MGFSTADLNLSRTLCATAEAAAPAAGSDPTHRTACGPSYELADNEATHHCRRNLPYAGRGAIDSSPWLAGEEKHCAAFRHFDVPSTPARTSWHCGANCLTRSK